MKAAAKRITEAKSLKVTANEPLVKGKRYKTISWVSTSDTDKKEVAEHFPAKATPSVTVHGGSQLLALPVPILAA